MPYNYIRANAKDLKITSDNTRYTSARIQNGGIGYIPLHPQNYTQESTDLLLRFSDADMTRLWKRSIKYQA